MKLDQSTIKFDKLTFIYHQWPLNGTFAYSSSLAIKYSESTRERVYTVVLQK